MSLAWTPWFPLAPDIQFPPATFAELLDGGQAFRWWARPSGGYRGQWSDHIVELRLADSPAAPPAAPRAVEWRVPAGTHATTASALTAYLGFTTRQNEALASLPVRSDAHLAKATAAFPGLRILRQPFGETLLGFLCSATKQIVQIKQMLDLLATRHGTPLPADCHLMDDNPPHALPTWAQLAERGEDELRDCQLGFRARYIKGTATFLAAHPGWLEATAQLPYAEAKAALCTLPGVGEKIADCVALFGLGHFEAFPVDTWMIKSMTRRYGLEGWTAPQVAHFGRTHFAQTAGLAQQYLFAWERAHGGR